MGFRCSWPRPCSAGVEDGGLSLRRRGGRESAAAPSCSLRPSLGAAAGASQALRRRASPGLAFSLLGARLELLRAGRRCRGGLQGLTAALLPEASQACGLEKDGVVGARSSSC